MDYRFHLYGLAVQAQEESLANTLQDGKRKNSIPG